MTDVARSQEERLPALSLPAGSEGFVLRAAGILVAVLIWQMLTDRAVLGPQFGPAFSPWSAGRALLSLLGSGELLTQIGPSLQRVLVGLALAATVGMPLGVLLGFSRRLELTTRVVFQFLRMISPLAWMPIAIIALGVGDRPIYFLIAVVAVWPIMINAAHGVASIEPTWIKVGRNLGASEVILLRRAIVPAVLPDVLTGLRVALGVAWVVLVPAEMLGVSAGLGYYILDARDRFAYSELMAIVLVIGLIGYLLDALIRAAQRRFAWSLHA